MSSRVQEIVAVVLLVLQEQQVVLGLIAPVRTRVVVEASVLGNISRVEEVDGLLALVLLPVLIVLGRLNRLALEPVEELLVLLLTELVDNALAIVVESPLDNRVGSCQSRVALGEDMLASEDASHRGSTEHEGRSVQTYDLASGLQFQLDAVGLAVLLRVLLVGLRLLDIGYYSVMFVEDIIHFQRRATGEKSRRRPSRNPETSQDLRGVLLHEQGRSASVLRQGVRHNLQDRV